LPTIISALAIAAVIGEVEDAARAALVEMCRTTAPRHSLTAAAERALLSLSTPEAIPDAAALILWRYLNLDPATPDKLLLARQAFAAALRVMADSKADTTSPICPPNNGEPVTKS
jgi:hypothetical protein